jgi:hypothetical protein
MKNFIRIASLLTVLFTAFSPFASFAPFSVSAYSGCCWPQPDLVAVKTNDLGGGDAIVGVSFNWIITVTNNGTATATFDKDEKILQDNLPPNGVGPYGTVSVSPSAGVTGVPGNLTCTQASADNRDLTCKVVNTYGRHITIPAGDYIVFSVAVTPDAAGSLSNPRGGGENTCKVDPSNKIYESNDNNNLCSNSVTVVEGCITNDDCDDDLYCNGEEICVDNECVQGTPIDCSAYDISGIATCDNDSPYDGNSYTWDFRNTFESQCDEDADECTIGDETIFSTCSVDNCQAECDAQHPCADTDCYQNKCIGNDLYTNTDVANSCQEDCTCTQNECEEPSISQNDLAQNVRQMMNVMV